MQYLNWRDCWILTISCNSYNLADVISDLSIKNWIQLIKIIKIKLTNQRWVNLQFFMVVRLQKGRRCIYFQTQAALNENSAWEMGHIKYACWMNSFDYVLLLSLLLNGKILEMRLLENLCNLKMQSNLLTWDTICININVFLN